MRLIHSHRIATAVITATLVAGGVVMSNTADAAAGTISGVAFQDANRDGVLESGELPFTGLVMYLFTSAGSYVGNSTTDSNGNYTFTGLADGTYMLQLSPSSWNSIDNDWVPTTTGSVTQTRMSVSLSGSAVANFGWRRIVRSTNTSAPITSYTGSNGLTVASYDDVVEAKTIFDALMQGSLVGSEAQFTTIRFDITSGSSTSTMTGQSNGTYTTYHATTYLDYQSWLNGGDHTLFHEYGHAWSLYYAYIVQQDPTLTSYLKARGLYGDPRLGTSHAWDPREIIAEDYRELFGTPSAQAGTQLNTDIPYAKDVPGLSDYLSSTFRAAPTAATTTTALSVSDVTAKQDAATKNWAISFTLSAPASVTVTVVNSSGTTVKTLLANASLAAGTSSVTWDRTDAQGRRAKRGTYTVLVQASTSSESASGSALVTI